MATSDDEGDDLEQRHRDLRPLHAAADEVPNTVKRLPGRPRRARPAPTFDQLEYVRKTRELRSEWIARDPLVSDPDGPELLYRVLAEAASEVAAMRFERDFRFEGKDPVPTTVRITAGLVRLAEIVGVIAKSGAGGHVAEERQLEVVRQVFLGAVADILQETLPGPTAIHTLNRIAAQLNQQATLAVFRGAPPASADVRQREL